MLPRAERLSRRRDFSAVYARKKSWADPLLVLYVRRTPPNQPDSETRRFGFSVSKKVGKAHDRNKIKRRLREICRHHRETWRDGFDVIFVARNAVANASFQEMEASVCNLMARASLLKVGRNPNRN